MKQKEPVYFTWTKGYVNVTPEQKREDGNAPVIFCFPIEIKHMEEKEVWCFSEYSLYIHTDIDTDNMKLRLSAITMAMEELEKLNKNK